MFSLGELLNHLGRQPQSITTIGSKEHMDRLLGDSAALKGQTLDDVYLEVMGEQMSGQTTDWYGTGSGRRQVRADRAARTQLDQQDLHDLSLDDENQYHASDSTVRLSTRGQPPCQRRKGSVDS